MTQKRILRATTKAVARERDLMLRDAFRAYWADLDDPKVADYLSQLAEGDRDETALELFGMVNRLLDEVIEISGETRENAYARLQRG